MTSDLLLPGGQPVDTAGSLEVIRELPGRQQEAKALFKWLSANGTVVTPAGHPGKLVRMPEGGHIGYCPKSTSGPPTIDLNVAGISIRKLKFPET